MGIGRIGGTFLNTPTGVPGGALWYCDANFGWKPTGQGLTFGNNATDDSARVQLGGYANAADIKFDSQGVALNLKADPILVINALGSGLRGEISWYRGSRAYPEAAIREHTSADTGLEIWVGAGTGAPSRIAQVISSGLTITGAVTGTTLVSTGAITAGNNLTVTTGGLTVTAGGLTVTAGGLTVSSGNVSLSGTTSLSGELQLANSQSALDTAQTKPVIYGTGGGGGAYPFSQAGHLILSPRISGASRDVLIYPNGTLSSAIFFSSGRTVIGTSQTDDGIRVLQLSDSKTISGTLADGFAAGLIITPTYTAATAQTVTRHSYLYLANPVLAGVGPAALTDAGAFYFDAAIGTHKAVDAATTKTSPGTVTAWVKINISGTIHYIPAYSSKTS